MKIVEHACEICGKWFMGPLGKKTCSDECEKARKAIANRAHYEKNRARYRDTHPLEVVECAWCGTKIYTRKKNRRFCSPYCREKYNNNASKTAQNKSQTVRREVDEFEAMRRGALRCGRPEFLLLDGTMEKLAETGQSYADYQKQKTLAQMKPIDVAAFMAELKRAEKEKK